MSQPELPARFAVRESDAADMRAIQEFLDEALITEVLNVIKSGKEATVYRCRAHPSLGAPFAAAKVYHTTGHRGFQRSAVYEEGRQFGAGQVQRAVANRSEFGQKAQLGFWVDREFDMLSGLNYAGADVPAPYACTETAILMEYLGDEDEAAVQLQHAEFGEGEAQDVLDRVLENIELLMRENVIHADLSAFNILYHEGRIAIIDFPQAVDPRTNSSAKGLLERDITNIVQFFQRQRAGLDEDPALMARNLWNLWKYGEV
ncbi:MAG: RIO1 family regulatory kinase/ATPase [bacterium]